MMEGLGAASTEPDADQRQISHTGPQQRHRQCNGQAFTGGLKDRSRHGQNIGRFYPGSLDLYFCEDSELVYDSGTPDPDSGIPGQMAAESTSEGAFPQVHLRVKRPAARA
jgi:hypothetical protein